MNLNAARSSVTAAGVLAILACGAGHPAEAMSVVSGSLSLNGYETLSGSDITFEPGSTLNAFGETGDFTELGTGGAVTFVDQGSAIDYNTLASVSNSCGTGCIYSASGSGDTTTFVLTSETVSNVGGNLTITGTGYITLTGYSNTPGTFTLTTQGSDGQLSFSTTSTAVPLPAALPLLGSGLGLFGLFARRRKLRLQHA